VRDSSRQRRDTSPSRRERELDRDRDRDRDEHRRRDGRDRDVERDSNDDPRRWRDDGKRDERLAARRELRDKEYREKERSSRVNERESNWDSDRNRDRERDRWVVDERDSRSKRTNGRDRPGHGRDEDRDERKDSRVRVEEKEPAWMDTYIPSDSGVGILGGKAENGELDGIQAWKLGMKEKERKERECEVSRSSGDAEHAGDAQVTDSEAVPSPEAPLDEIQLFKLMIKREEEKHKAASLKGPMNDPAVAYLIPGTDSGVSLACYFCIFIHNHRYAAVSTQKPPMEVQPTSGFVPSPSVEALTAPAASSTKSSTPSIESPKPPGSRFFPNPSTSDSVAFQGQQERQSASTIRSPIPSQFNPPPGSRLLAFGSRTPSATAATTVSPDQPSAFTISASTLDAPLQLQHLVNGPHRVADMDTSNPDSIARNSVATGLPPPGFSNLINPTRLTGFLNEGNTHVQSEILRRQSLVSFGDRMTYGTTSDLGAYSEMGSTNPLGPQSNSPNSQSPSFDSGRERGHGGSPFPQQKGSRFAKFFESREQPAVPLTEDLGSLVHHPLRQQGVVGGEPYPLGIENRTMEDIFAMLQNSTQVRQLEQVFAQCLMFIRDSVSPNLLAITKHLLFIHTGTFLLRDSLSWSLWGGIMTSCMTIVWTTATSSPMD
jgi:zinc finger CCCH domain-containing protein 13